MTRHDARTPTHRHVILLVAAVSLAVLLTACAEPAAEPIPTAGQPAPAAPPPSSVTATTTPTPTQPAPSPTRKPTPTTGPTAKVPPMPKGATRPTEKGVALAAIYYLDDLLDHVTLTGDAAPFSRYCRPEVLFCTEFVDDAARRREAKRYLVVGEMKFSEIEVGQTVIDGETHHYFDAIGHLERSQHRDYAGSLIEEIPAGIFRVQLTLVHVDGAWRIATGYSERLQFLP